MSQLTHEQYNRLERAVTRSERIAVSRKGGELILVPLAMRTHKGREVIDARNPTTGDALLIYLDEVDSLESL
ncbi:MAG: hypothetical protein AABZ80_07765 [Gemmatimonadota bacterium]